MNPAPSLPEIRALQLGKSWFTEQSGGGLDRMFDGLMRHLPAVQVHGPGFVVGDERDEDGVAIQGIARNEDAIGRRLWSFRQAVKRAVREGSYQLAASHFALYTVAVLDLLKPLPHVIHFHGPWAEESQSEGASAVNVKVKAAIERRVYARGDRFIVLSEAFADILMTRFQVPAARIHIVPGGVDVGSFDTGHTRREARAKLGWPTDRPLILTVRRLAQRMGLENLIDAVQEVRVRIPDALLLIAGTGPLAGGLHERIEEKGLQEHVRLVGFVAEEDLPLAYRAADVSVVPSLKLEGFGLVTIESLAAGTPVLVSPVGGLPAVVRDLSETLVLPDTSTSSLAAILSDLLLGALPVPDAEACHAYARQHFDWPVIARRTRRVYEDVLQ